MAYRWPDETVFRRLELHVEEQWCQTCGSRLRVCDHRHRRVFTLQGPLHVVCKLVHCPDLVGRADPGRTPFSMGKNIGFKGPDRVSISTLTGRVVVPFIMGKYQAARFG